MAKDQDRVRSSLYLGTLFLAVGGLLSAWVIRVTFIRDAQTETPTILAVMIALQAVMFLAGLVLLVRRPRISLEISMSVISTVAVLLALEGGVRLWLWQFASEDQLSVYGAQSSQKAENLAFTGHHYLNYIPTPNYKRGLLSHNSLGFRDDEFPAEKPVGTFRIFVLGGSTTYSTGVEDNSKTFTAQLERLLADEYGYRNVDVINAGATSYSSWESLLNLQFRVLDLGPDLVIVYHGINDVAARFADPSSYKGDNSGMRKQWASPARSYWEESALLRLINRKLGLTRPVVLDDLVDEKTPTDFGNLSLDTLMQNPPIYFRRNLENMVAIAREHDVPIMLATWAFSPHFAGRAANPNAQHAFAENNSVVGEVAESHPVPIFDFASIMPQDRNYWVDGIHVNEAGSLVKAKLFAQFIHDSELIPIN